MIKSHDTEEKTEESKDSLESTQKEEERPRSPTPPPARKSPEPSCAICLEHLTNKSFTDSCFHMFCFTCLVEWSKVKPECPLCKKSFSSIVHNVRSFKEYDQYYVNKSRITEENRHCIRRFHYRTTLTPERYDNNRLELDSYLSHRMRYAPHSLHSLRIQYASSALMPSRRNINSFRQRIYDEDLWVCPQNSNRIRCISPAFFRQNIACTHRLLPWLNRELMVVMPNNESQISFVIELIMALIVKYEIRSQEFHTLIEPYTASQTAHFIHEFYNFAVSPYETVESYDQHAQYNLASSYETVSSPDSDVIALPMDYSSSLHPSSSNESSRRKKQSHPRKKHSKGSKKLKKMILKRNSEKNVWESSFTPAPSVPFLNNIPSSLSFELPGPSTSRAFPFRNSPPDSPNTEIDISNEVECLEPNDNDEEEVDDDECQVVDVLKPKCERTPEIVDLSSDDELSNIVSEVTVEDKENDTVISVIDDNDEDSDDLTLILSDDECEILYCKESENSQDANSTTEVVNDKPIDYSLKTIEKKPDIESNKTIAEPCSSNNNASSNQDKLISEDVSHLPKCAEDSKLDVVKTEKSSVKSEKTSVKAERSSSVIQSVVHAVTHEETGSSSLSPLLKPKKRKSVFLDDVSTESCSDGAQVSEIDTSKGKLKLKSVVAHYSFEHSDGHETSHHSSLHKKHKDRKKKKKKHKHRRRVYSSDSD